MPRSGIPNIQLTYEQTTLARAELSRVEQWVKKQRKHEAAEQQHEAELLGLEERKAAIRQKLAAFQSKYNDNINELNEAALAENEKLKGEVMYLRAERCRVEAEAEARVHEMEKEGEAKVKEAEEKAKEAEEKAKMALMAKDDEIHKKMEEIEILKKDLKCAIARVANLGMINHEGSEAEITFKCKRESGDLLTICLVLYKKECHIEIVDTCVLYDGPKKGISMYFSERKMESRLVILQPDIVLTILPETANPCRIMKWAQQWGFWNLDPVSRARVEKCQEAYGNQDPSPTTPLQA